MQATRSSLGFVASTLLLLAPAAPAAAVDAELWGLSLGVRDVATSAAFYRDTLDMDLVSQGEATAILRTGELYVLLHRSTRDPAPFGSPRTYLNLTVDDLQAAVARVVAGGGGVEPGGVGQSAVGPAITVLDPDGHPMNLIDHPWDDDQPADSARPAVRLFNVGLRADDKAAYEDFFAGLGIGIRTREYLPKTLVMVPRGGAQLVVHDAFRASLPGQDRGELFFVATGSLQASDLAGADYAAAGPWGSWLDLHSPSGTPARLFLDPHAAPSGGP